jgi:molecular chaperone DnaJ
MQAANNYIRNGYYAEAMNVLEGIASADRAARWHYYAALASSGLGNNIRAQNEARTAVDMEPGNYEYQNLLDRLQNPGRAYSTYQQAYTQPGSRQHGMNFCLQAWLYLMLCNLCSICCCGGRGGFYIC